MVTYDAIVVGGRCAGAPTAMRLAQRGYSVLVLDRASFPSDTVSTHIIKYPGVTRLKDWGLLEDVIRTNTPPIRRFQLDIGTGPVSGDPPPQDGVPMIAPRRVYLDEILVQAASDAGAEFREEFVVRDLIFESGRVVGVNGQPKGGSMETYRGRIIIGADGKNSFVARTVDAPMYDEASPMAFYYYAYWPDLDVDTLESYWRQRQFVLAIPTTNDLTCLMVGRPIDYLQPFSEDVEASYRETLAITPEYAAAVEGEQPVDGYSGTAVQNYFRRPFGRGWALVGDAGLCMDPLNGHGISDAFCDADLLAEALDAGFSGQQPLQDALEEYERERNERKEGYYEPNWKNARLEDWDDARMRRLMDALRDNPDQADRWAGMHAFSIHRDEFYGSEFVEEAVAES